MADDADRAEQQRADSMQRWLDEHLSKQEQESAYYCDRCDEPIPERRRQAVPGVRECVFCAAYEERRR